MRGEGIGRDGGELARESGDGDARDGAARDGGDEKGAQIFVSAATRRRREG